MGLRISESIQKSLNAKIDETFKNAVKEFVLKLAEAGEISVRTAIQRGNYEDRTGDLRNSIGYLVAIDGVSAAESFTATNPGREAREKAMLKASEVKGLTLIVIAGKSYAAYVQSQGFDVLASAGQIARKLIPELLKK